MNIRKMMLLVVLFVAGQMQAQEELKICGQNVQNYFMTLDRGRTDPSNATWSSPNSFYNTAEGFNKKTSMLISALAPLQADIYAFNEVECKPEVLPYLAQKMGEANGYTYAAVADGLDYDTSDPDNASGVIKSGYIYRTDKVKTYGENKSAAIGYSYIYPNQMRIQTFECIQSGERFTLTMNHFKAGSTEDDMSKRITNMSALLQAFSLALDPDILVMGDLNSQMGEECLNMLVNAGYEEQILKYDPTGANVYSHCYGGGELIDHVFANASMAAQVTAAQVYHIANYCSLSDEDKAYSDHDPYMVTLSLDKDAYKPDLIYFTKATSVTTDKEYLMVCDLNGGLKAAKPVPAGKDYDYLYTESVTEENGAIALAECHFAFTFEDAGNNLYYVKDANGRYVYQNANGGSYYTTIAVTTDKSLAQPFSVTLQGDGTFKILNTISNCYFQGMVYKSTTPEFALYDQARDFRYMPWLYEKSDGKPTSSITEIPSFSQQSMTIYDLQGRKVSTTLKSGLYIMNGKKVLVK